MADAEPYIELVQSAGPRIWEVKTHPDLVVKLAKAPALWLRDAEDKHRQSFVKGKRYRLKDLRKGTSSVYWTVEGLMRER